MRSALATLTVLAGAAAFPGTALASSGADPTVALLLYLVAILLSAKAMGHLAVLAGQPAVLGELVAGILLGNLHHFGIRGLEGIASDPSVNILAQVGVVLLLFGVGLESTVREILRVGASSFLVAVLGVAVPFALGWGVGAWLLPGASPLSHAFLGATLCATSVGITARVLRDIGRSSGIEARIILGAAVIDDVLGLIVLAAISGAIAAAGAGGGSYGILPVAVIALKAAGFLVVSLLLGALVAPRIFSAAAGLKGPGVLIGISLAFCFLLSWLSGIAGLAPIVGAFAAGLLLEPLHFRKFGERDIHRLEDELRPLTEMLAPVFFVRMGAEVDFAVLASPEALRLALALTAAAILGKQVCSLGVLEKGTNRWAVGLGMIPRGEVGLIFASIGATLTLGGERIVGEAAYSALVLMVIATTLVTPPLLKRSLAAGKAADPVD